MHVARVTAEPDGRDSDLCLVHVLLLEAHSVQHGLGSSLRLGLGDVARHLVKADIFVLEAGKGGRKSTTEQVTNV